jgi:PQQ-dependent catabolism-associated beta-propeller protein
VAASTVWKICIWLALSAGPVGAGEMWITNEKDHTVSVIDTKTQELKASYNVGLRPRGIIFAKDFSELYVCASDDDRIDVLDPETGVVIRSMPSGEDPEQFALHPNNRYLYIANEEDAMATVLDVTSDEVLAEINVGIEPEGMAVSPDGKIAIVTSETTNMVHWIDTEAQRLFANTLVGQRPRHGEFNTDGSKLWVSSEIGGAITILNVATQQIEHIFHLKIPGVSKDLIQPVDIRLTADGSKGFIALGPANHVAVIDARTYEVLDFVLVGRRVWHLAFDETERHIYSTNGISGDVTIINVASLRPIKTLKVGRFPWGAAFRPD